MAKSSTTAISYSLWVCINDTMVQTGRTALVPGRLNHRSFWVASPAACISPSGSAELESLLVSLA
jgi:hypothetical protein